MIGLKRGTVLLMPHDREWDAFAAEIISRLKEILGKTAVDIQHVGSTSVRQIKAKPIIDIAVAVKDTAHIKRFIPILERNGFVKKDVGRPSEVFFSCGDFTQDIRTCHVHVVNYKSTHWYEYILFRDYLSDHIYEAREYEALKVELAEKYPNDRESYTEGKAEKIKKILRKAHACSCLGKITEIVVDRPMGSVHPENENMIYPLNYGYLPNIRGGDGEEMDVYLMGVNTPVSSYKCRIIAVVFREDDAEDKLVAAPVGTYYHQAEISEAVDFQEKYFRTVIDPIYHRSCGSVVFRNTGTEPEFLLLFQKGSGTWSFPKGHMEKYETEEETAFRETEEEVGIRIKVHSQYKCEVNYPISKYAKKTVVLFLAETEDVPTIRNPKEISDYRWMNALEAKRHLHPDYGRIIEKFNGYIKELSEK